jgi:hypothetical protein
MLDAYSVCKNRWGQKKPLPLLNPRGRAPSSSQSPDQPPSSAVDDDGEREPKSILGLRDRRVICVRARGGGANDSLTFVGDYFGNTTDGSTDISTFVSTYGDSYNPLNRQQQVVAEVATPSPEPPRPSWSTLPPPPEGPLRGRAARMLPPSGRFTSVPTRRRR